VATARSSQNSTFGEILPSCFRALFSVTVASLPLEGPPIDESGSIFAEGANALALQLPNEADRPPVAWHVEQLARAPSHLRSISAPCVEEQAPVI
jgi:hypothetical protein